MILLFLIRPHSYYKTAANAIKACNYSAQRTGTPTGTPPAMTRTSPPSSPENINESLDFSPVFNEKGLIPCIVTSARNGTVLMMAWMNQEALDRTLSTGEAHYWSRSRGELWRKGATSGQTQKVSDLRIDCDQDCLLLTVDMPEPETACHTGRNSCFYRVVGTDGRLMLKT